MKIAVTYEDGRVFQHFGHTAQFKLYTVEDGKVFAVTADGRFLVRERLYQLEERYCHAFVKINQSCLVNVSLVNRFSASIGGSLRVEMKNGFFDYVSRRQIKAVKERLGLK